MTLEEFKKAIKTTNDVKSLIENHIIATGYGAIEYNDYIIPFNADYVDIEVTDEDHIEITLKELRNDLSILDVNHPSHKVCSLSYRIKAEVMINIYDILKGSTEAKVYSSDIEVCTDSKTINWDNYGNYIEEIYEFLYDAPYDIIYDAKNIIAKLLAYNVFYFHDSNNEFKKLYDQMIQDFDNSDDEISFEDCKAYFKDNIDEFTDEYECIELLNYIDDLYDEDNKAVDKEELDNLALLIVDKYYEGFNFESILVNLADLHDADKTPNVVTINFFF